MNILRVRTYSHVLRPVVVGRGIPCPVRIYYDPFVLPPPPPMLHCAAGLIRAASTSCDPPPDPMLQPPLMLIPLTCNAVPGVALADSGASHVYVTADFAHRVKADIRPCPHLSVHLADSDTKVPIEGMCKIKITLHRKHSVWVTAFVFYPTWSMGCHSSWVSRG